MDSNNEELLKKAAANGENMSVEKLLADGTKVNCRDEHGWTPLHWAAQNGYKDTVKLLISKGAEVQIAAYNGLTPLHCAADDRENNPIAKDWKMKQGPVEDHKDIVDCLISNKADIDVKDKDGRTPYDFASSEEMKKRLKSFKEGIMAGLPLELIHLDKESARMFANLLKEESYPHFELRSMLQGEQGTGKTTIARFLVGKGPTLFRMSTDGIDLYTGLSFFDAETNKWLDGKQDFALEDITVSRSIKPEQDLSNETQIEMKEQKVTASLDNTDRDITNQGFAPQLTRETEHTVTEPIPTDNAIADKTNIMQAKAPLPAVQSPQNAALSTTEPDGRVKIIKNLGVIDKLKAFFGVNTDVDEIKVSVTEAEFFGITNTAAKKNLHKRKVVPVTIWDFGGQDVFYSTHQTFLTYRAVYMLVLDGSRTLDQPCKYEVFLPGRDGVAKTQKDYVRFWINTIITYCKGESAGFPKILVILTHKDKLKVNEIETRRNEIFREIKEMFHGTSISQHLAIEDKIFVNARDSNDHEMQKIKQSLIREAKNQPTWGQRWPKCFLPLELEIQSLVKKGYILIHVEHIKKINSQHPIRPLNDSELKGFLKFQHAVGKILYFDVTNLDKNIIILPTFLIDAFKSIITDQQFCKGDKNKEEAWYSMSKKGIIFKKAVETIWKQKYTLFYKSKGYLLGVMNHLDILVEPKRYDSSQARISTDFYYVASMVRKQDTTGYLQSSNFVNRNIAISFETPGSIIPPGLSFRFISYCLSIWGVKTYGNDNEDMLFHSSAVFAIDPSLDVHIQCDDERLIIRLVHATSGALIMKDLASSVRECLFEAIHKISQLYISTGSESTKITQSFEVKVCCSSSTNPCFIALKNIGEVWICPIHHIEHTKHLVLSWFTEKRKESCDSYCSVTDKTFLLQKPNDLHLRRLAVEYDKNDVRKLVTALGLPYSVWDELNSSTLTEESIKFTALLRCSEKMLFTFNEIKLAAEKEEIKTPHTICKVLRDEQHVTFDTEPKLLWDSTLTDKHIDKLAPLVGNKSLSFLVELGLTFQHWEQIEYSQRERDLVKLNRAIMEEWRKNCKIQTLKPALRTIGQAFGNIGKNIGIIETTLFNC